MIDLTGLAPAIVTAIETESGRPVGDGRLPGPENTNPAMPFAVVYELPSPHEATAFGFPNDMTWLHIQITSVGETASQARWMSGQVRAAIVGKTGGTWTQPIDPAGLEICARNIDEWGGPVGEDGTVNVHDRYRFLITG